MLNWLLRRHKPEQAPVVKEAQRAQDARFDAWADTLAEVKRVEHMVNGKQRKKASPR